MCTCKPPHRCKKREKKLKIRVSKSYTKLDCKAVTVVSVSSLLN